jgi:rubrerythrin
VITSELTALEALGIAIRREIDAGQVFRDLASSCSNPLAADRFVLLTRESAQQERLLRDRYDMLFPGVPLLVPPSVAPPPGRSTGPGPGDGLRAALRFAADAERQAREFYLDAANAATELTGQAMFRYLAEVHARHQSELEAEYAVILQYPRAFDDVPAPWRPEVRVSQ